MSNDPESATERAAGSIMAGIPSGQWTFILGDKGEMRASGGYSP
jgi:hypothetical protein